MSGDLTPNSVPSARELLAGHGCGADPGRRFRRERPPLRPAVLRRHPRARGGRRRPAGRLAGRARLRPPATRPCGRSGSTSRAGAPAAPRPPPRPPRSRHRHRWRRAPPLRRRRPERVPSPARRPRPAAARLLLHRRSLGACRRHALRRARGSIDTDRAVAARCRLRARARLIGRRAGGPFGAGPRRREAPSGASAKRTAGPAADEAGAGAQPAASGDGAVGVDGPPGRRNACRRHAPMARRWRRTSCRRPRPASWRRYPLWPLPARRWERAADDAGESERGGRGGGRGAAGAPRRGWWNRFVRKDE